MSAPARCATCLMIRFLGGGCRVPDPPVVLEDPGIVVARVCKCKALANMKSRAGRWDTSPNHWEARF